MYACVQQAMAQFVLKIEKNVPYHGANPNTRSGACLRSPSLIMAPGSNGINVGIFSILGDLGFVFDEISKFKLRSLAQV